MSRISRPPAAGAGYIMQSVMKGRKARYHVTHTQQREQNAAWHHVCAQQRLFVAEDKRCKWKVTLLADRHWITTITTPLSPSPTLFTGAAAAARAPIIDIHTLLIGYCSIEVTMKRIQSVLESAPTFLYWGVIISGALKRILVKTAMLS